jgi:hypothetical protein
MPKDHNDWRRRFTEQDTDDEEQHQQPRAITVLVDEQGVVSDVVIPARWRDSVHPEDLGRALAEAANKAMADRIAEQTEQFDPNAPPQFTTRDAPSAHGDPTSPVAQSLVNEVLELLSTYSSELDAYTARLREIASAASRAEGTDGRIVVTFATGQVSAEADAAWAASARRSEIRAEALSAFQAAQRQAAPVALPPSLARLVELASDPEALCRQLGLTR